MTSKLFYGDVNDSDCEEIQTLTKEKHHSKNKVQHLKERQALKL